VKILQINIVYKEKSTGRTCYEVKRVLENCGHKGYVAYGKGKHTDENTYRIGSDIEYYFHNIMARITGLQGYFSYFATMRLIKYIKQISPDIIHLRNLHANYLNLPKLFRFLKDVNIPIVLNLHDCWAITGKCPHFTDIQCFKWKVQCNNCPVIHNYPQSLFFDKTKKLYNDKKRWLNNIKDLTVVGVSKWTTDQAKMSFLSNRHIITIYNWINRSVFYPRNDNILKFYGIDVNKFTILGVSTSWTAGSPRYDDFMRLSNLIHDDMQIVLAGQSSTTEWPMNIKHIPFISDINELAKLYSSVDVYVHLSTEDTFGKVVTEAMACGVPAIVYNSTALPEIIEEGCGYVVEKRDIKGVLEAILEIKRKGKSHYSNSCVSHVTKNFDYDHNTKVLIELYESILKG
jgi:putative colanic acid biosynthesis glycosyltransferase